MTSNQISFYKARNEAKHYKRLDKENKRHNKAVEDIDTQKNLLTDWINRKQAEIGLINAGANVTQATAADKRAETEYAKYQLEHDIEYGRGGAGPDPLSYELKAEEIVKKHGETGLINKQTDTEEARLDLITEQGRTEHAKRTSLYGKSAKDVVGSLIGIWNLTDGVAQSIGEVQTGDVLITSP